MGAEGRAHLVCAHSPLGQAASFLVWSEGEIT